MTAEAQAEDIPSVDLEKNPPVPTQVHDSQKTDRITALQDSVGKSAFCCIENPLRSFG